MKTYEQFYINGEWVDPAEGINSFDVLNPANEEVIGSIAMGSAADVDKAVEAASNAFDSFSQTSVEERLAILGKIVEVYQSRYDEIAETISSEMGAPLTLSKAAQAASDAVGAKMVSYTGLRGTYDFVVVAEGTFEQAAGIKMATEASGGRRTFRKFR